MIHLLAADVQVLLLFAAASRPPAVPPADVERFLRKPAHGADAAAFNNAILWRLTVRHSLHDHTRAERDDIVSSYNRQHACYQLCKWRTQRMTSVVISRSRQLRR